MKVDVVASQPHFVDHLVPVWRALPRGMRGGFYTPRSAARRRAARLGVAAKAAVPSRRSSRVAVLASHGDRPHIGVRPYIYIEHGTAQSYGGQPPDGTSPDVGHSCPMIAAAVPNEACAYRNRLHHPHAVVEVTGCPKLDVWHDRGRHLTVPPTVGLLWHWPNRWICPESDWAFPHWKQAVETLAARDVDERGYRLVGHGHPRAWPSMAGFYRRNSISTAAGLEDVWDVASTVVFDTTSAGWESAAVGIPVVLLDQPAYRRGVEHGVRFWEHADAGCRVGSGDPDDLHEAITATLTDDPAAAGRRRAVDALYPLLDGGATDRVVALIERVVND